MNDGGGRNGPTMNNIRLIELREHNEVFNNSMIVIVRKDGVFDVQSEGGAVIGQVDPEFWKALGQAFDRLGRDSLPGCFHLEGGPHVSTDVVTYAERRGIDLTPFAFRAKAENTGPMHAPQADDDGAAS